MDLFALNNEPEPRPWQPEPAEAIRQRVLFAGMDSLPGQMDLFPTDGESHETEERKERTMTRVLTQAEIYWDSQDPANEGWAFRLTYGDGHQESGEWEGSTPVDAAFSDLEDAVVDLAYQNGVEIERGNVAAEPKQDGGYACWTA